jgi:hypothetical protein
MRDVHVIKQRTYGSLFFLHLALTKHELGESRLKDHVSSWPLASHRVLERI